jgi:uncharacterized protein YlxP (DUF503 family)
MFVAVGRIQLTMQQNNSLKDKRRLLSSITGRVRSKFNVSIAEVDLQDVWRQGVLGIAVVGSSAAFAQESLETVVRFIEGYFPVEIPSITIDVL